MATLHKGGNDDDDDNDNDNNNNNNNNDNRYLEPQAYGLINRF